MSTGERCPGFAEPCCSFSCHACQQVRTQLELELQSVWDFLLVICRHQLGSVAFFQAGKACMQALHTMLGGTARCDSRQTWPAMPKFARQYSQLKGSDSWCSACTLCTLPAAGCMTLQGGMVMKSQHKTCCQQHSRLLSVTMSTLLLECGLCDDVDKLGCETFTLR
jgi:hypothetical protein